MPLAEIALRFDPWGVLLSYLTASFAAYVALDLAKRVRTPDRTMARVWWAAGSLSMGTGIWAMHFVGMLALELPFVVGYGHGLTALSWLAAVLASAIALYVATGEQLGPRRLALGSLTMAAGICAMHYTGMAALELLPAIRWHGGWVAASVGIAVVAAAAALKIFFWLRGLQGARAVWGQVGAALLMGAAVAGMHFTGMAAAGIADGTVCLSADGLGGDMLGQLVALASFCLLLVTLLSSTLEARLQARAARLSQSLQDANEQLLRLAYRDALTGLANRLLFEDRVAHAVQRSRRDGQGLAVLYLDLDGFKPINDTFGHAEGDLVLQAVAKRLRDLARDADTVARLGGDEFVLLLEGAVSEAQAAQVAQRAIEALQPPVGERGHRVTCSIGIALNHEDEEGGQVLAQADSAMYVAKRAGGASFAFFEADADADVREQLELRNELAAALAAGDQLRLLYQPKLDVARGVVADLEALLRWQHPRRGLLEAAQFVPVAERFGLIDALGQWSVAEACRQLAAWREQGVQLRVALDLSTHQLRQPERLLAQLREVLAEHALEPGWLSFEISESAAMEDSAEIGQALQHLGALGLPLVVDDFGSGCSRLATLRRLAVVELKIDRGLVGGLGGEPGQAETGSEAIVTAIIHMAHALGLRVVAEGVATAAQASWLGAQGCDQLQGELIAPPLSAAQLLDWVRSGQGGPAFSSSAFQAPDSPAA